jgi:nitrogen fixation/metabolism regulation signal transduction histidine kinase
VSNAQVENAALPKPTRPLAGVAIAVVCFSLLILIAIIPPVRDWLIGCLTDETRKGISANKPYIVGWIEFVRVLFEVLVGLCIGNVIFNKGIQTWYEQFTDQVTRQIKVLHDAAVAGEKDPEKRHMMNVVIDVIANGIAHAAPVITPGIVRTVQYRILELLTHYGLLVISASIFFLGSLLMKAAKLWIESPAMSS